tara:strand:- start:642 stop:794 length:153 start_codon:yes stop_codon:yes gene_type:complete
MDRYSDRWIDGMEIERKINRWISIYLFHGPHTEVLPLSHCRMIVDNAGAL